MILLPKYKQQDLCCIFTSSCNVTLFKLSHGILTSHDVICPTTYQVLVCPANFQCALTVGKKQESSRANSNSVGNCKPLRVPCKPTFMMLYIVALQSTIDFEVMIHDVCTSKDDIESMNHDST